MKSRSLPLLLCLCASSAFAGDQPQWGQAWTRNLVSSETGLPESWDLETGHNVRWVAPLGTQSFSTPIIAGGRVYIGTNNEAPRDPQHLGDRGAFYCLDEKDGHLLWQLLSPKRVEDQYYDWPKTGMSSPITIEGDRGYLVDNRGEVLCLDVQGLANGNDGPFQEEAARLTPRALTPEFNGGATAPGAPQAATPPESLTPTDADIIWRLDLPSAAGTWPHDGAHSSIVVLGDYLYLNTGTGVDNTHRAIRRDEAPSLVVLEKKTGRLIARDDEHISPNIFHASWSSPAVATIGGQELIIFAGGDGIIRAFEPITALPPAGEVAKLKLVWQYDFDPAAPKQKVHQYVGNRQISPSDIYGMPVLSDGKLFVAGGGDIWWGKNEAFLKCLDPSSLGNPPRELWSYPLEKHVLATPAVSNGLVFIADIGRKIHCLDATTGQPCWTHEAKGDFWASPLIADGKLYIGSRKGDFYVLSASREKHLLATIDFKAPISGTATAANGVLYVSTSKALYALKREP